MQLVMSFLLLTVSELNFYQDLPLSFLPQHPPFFFFPYIGILVATIKILLTRKQNCEAYYQASNQNFHCTSLHITSTLLRMSNSIDASKGSLCHLKVRHRRHCYEHRSFSFHNMLEKRKELVDTGKSAC